MNWYKISLFHKLSSISSKELDILRKIVQKIINGNKKWSTQELQIQQNYPEMLEELLMKKFKEIE